MIASRATLDKFSKRHILYDRMECGNNLIFWAIWKKKKKYIYIFRNNRCSSFAIYTFFFSIFPLFFSHLQIYYYHSIIVAKNMVSNHANFVMRSTIFVVFFTAISRTILFKLHGFIIFRTQLLCYVSWNFFNCDVNQPKQRNN